MDIVLPIGSDYCVIIHYIRLEIVVWVMGMPLDLSLLKVMVLITSNAPLSAMTIGIVVTFVNEE